jgi:hypothetical protein
MKTRSEGEQLGQAREGFLWQQRGDVILLVELWAALAHGLILKLEIHAFQRKSSRQLCAKKQARQTWSHPSKV